jgi:hypothetical protein
VLYHNFDEGPGASVKNHGLLLDLTGTLNIGLFGGSVCYDATTERPRVAAARYVSFTLQSLYFHPRFYPYHISSSSKHFAPVALNSLFAFKLRPSYLCTRRRLHHFFVTLFVLSALLPLFATPPCSLRAHFMLVPFDYSLRTRSPLFHSAVLQIFHHMSFHLYLCIHAETMHTQTHHTHTIPLITWLAILL